MSWDYADLSKQAKAAGGPEAFVDAIAKAHEDQGKRSMYPWMAGVGILCATAGAVVTKLIEHFREKWAVSKAKLEVTKEELIQGIKDYDAAHPEPADGDFEEGFQTNGHKNQKEEKSNE